MMSNIVSLRTQYTSACVWIEGQKALFSALPYSRVRGSGGADSCNRHMSHILDSLKGGCMGDYIGE